MLGTLTNEIPEGAGDWSRLMAAAQAGDSAAYSRLLREILPYVRAIVRRQHIAPDRVEDVVRDVLLTLHGVRHAYDPARPFAAWLGAVAQRRSADTSRPKARRVVQAIAVLTPARLRDLPDVMKNYRN